MDAGAALGDLADEYGLRLKSPANSDTGGVGFLRFCRINRVGDPSHIFERGREVLRNAGSTWSLGDEYWGILEQLCIASLQLYKTSDAEEYCAKLQTQFAGSSRVQRLVGLILEAKGDWDAARSVYDGLLEANPANSLAWKRKVKSIATSLMKRMCCRCISH